MEAAAELYDRYAGQVHALARRIVGNETDAEVVVQERRLSLHVIPLGGWTTLRTVNARSSVF